MEHGYASVTMAPGQSVSWKDRVLECSSPKRERAKPRERQHLPAFTPPTGDASVLPLPLVPFESYMLADHRPAYPMNCITRLRFAGRFDRSTLDTAMSAALARHPLLTALARPAGSRWVWKPTEHPQAVAWLEAAPAGSLPSLEPLDVRVAPGLRVVACEGPTQTDLVLQAHHACSDGLGLFLFAEDLLMSYAVARGLIPVESLRPVRAEHLRTRGRFGLTAAPLLKVVSRQLFGLAGARQFLMRTPEPLVPHRAQPDDAPLPSNYPASWTRQLDEAQTAGLLAAARTLGVTLNDLLARELFICLARWQQRFGRDGQRGWLRLCVPMSLRTAVQDRLPAANSVGMLFLDRRPRDMEAPDRLLASIHKEMQLLKRMQLGWTFVLSLGLCQWLPGGLERRCRNPRCMSTAVLTNLGVLFAHGPLTDGQGRLRIGEVSLEQMDLLPPWRPLTCAAFTVWSYANRLSFTLHYDARVLAADEAGELLDHFVELNRKQACRTC
jgi:hypothetical protein